MRYHEVLSSVLSMHLQYTQFLSFPAINLYIVHAVYQCAAVSVPWPAFPKECSQRPKPTHGIGHMWTARETDGVKLHGL